MDLIWKACSTFLYLEPCQMVRQCTFKRAWMEGDMEGGYRLPVLGRVTFDYCTCAISEKVRGKSLKANIQYFEKFYKWK